VTLNQTSSAAAAWSGPPGTEQVVETHTALVFLTEDHAFKIRKPLRFAFVDYTSIGARRAAAEAEVALNTATAPGVYLGVRALVERAGVLELAESDDEDGAVDHVVVMRRFAEADTLAERLARGRIDEDALRRIGRRIAEMHRAARVVAGGASRALARVDRNGEELVELRGTRPGAADVGRVVGGLQMAMLARAAELETRAGAGRWRDGHGDLRAEHVLIESDGLRIVDRLEFDADLRCDDVAADLAFLLMDLEARGERAAAQTILAAYRADGGDVGGDRLLACWAAYRATVAAKVAHLRGLQGVTESAATGDDRLRLARRLLWRASGAVVLVVCGPPATGKSTLAAAIGRLAGAEVVSSDALRKARLGLPRTERAPGDAYTPAVTAVVYGELGTRAASLAQRDGIVVVDATMHNSADRALMLAALDGVGPVRWVICSAPPSVTHERAAVRMSDPSSASDATPVVAAALAAAWEPLDEITAAAVLTIRTDRPLDLVAEQVESWVWATPAD
jgi:aminoglycoside phosphotransferase family enzyme/predicted kinase